MSAAAALTCGLFKCEIQAASWVTAIGSLSPGLWSQSLFICLLTGPVCMWAAKVWKPTQNQKIRLNKTGKNSGDGVPIRQTQHTQTGRRVRADVRSTEAKKRCETLTCKQLIGEPLMSGCLSLLTLFRRLNTLPFFLKTSAWRRHSETFLRFWSFWREKKVSGMIPTMTAHIVTECQTCHLSESHASACHMSCYPCSHTHTLRWKLGNAACHAVPHATHSCINIAMLSADAPTKILVPTHLHSRHRCLHARLFLRTYVLSFQQRPWNIYLHTLFKWKECTLGCSLQ